VELSIYFVILLTCQFASEYIELSCAQPQRARSVSRQGEYDASVASRQAEYAFKFP